MSEIILTKTELESLAKSIECVLKHLSEEDHFDNKFSCMIIDTTVSIVTKDLKGDNVISFSSADEKELRYAIQKSQVTEQRLNYERMKATDFLR